MWTVVAYSALAWIAVCAAAFALQDRLVFFPGGPPTRTPAAIGLDFTELRLRASDGVALSAWWIPRERARGAGIVCHGNAGSIEHRLELARALHELGFAVLLFDYRGYGASAGVPSERGLYLDADAAYEHVAGELAIPAERIVAYGESLGGAVAAQLAARRPVGALVLDSAFTSLADIGADAYPFLPVRLLLRSRFDTRAALERITAPMLITHGHHDQIVPFAHAVALRDATGGRARLVPATGGHNDGTWQRTPETRAALESFFDEHFAR